MAAGLNPANSVHPLPGCHNGLSEIRSAVILTEGVAAAALCRARKKNRMGQTIALGRVPGMLVWYSMAPSRVDGPADSKFYSKKKGYRPPVFTYGNRTLRATPVSSRA